MKIKKYYKLFFNCLRISLMEKMTDRMNFFSIAIGVFIQIGVSVLFFQAIYAQTNSLGGWSINEVYVLLGTFFLIDSVGAIFYIRGYYQLANMIEDGRLDLFLSKPLNLRLYFIFHRVDLIHNIPSLIISFCLISYGLSNLNFGINFLQYFLLLICGIVIHFSVRLIFQTFNFFYRLFGLNQLLSAIFDLGQYPVSIYKGFVRIMFFVGIPLALIYSLPVQAIFGKASLFSILSSLLIMFIFYYLSKLFWNFSLKKYESGQG